MKLDNIWTGIVVGFIACWLLVQVDSDSYPDIEAEYSYEGIPMVITTYVYDDQDKLVDNYPLELARGDYLYGFANMYNTNVCEIHAMGDDEFINTLGHELAHCLYGLWHPD